MARYALLLEYDGTPFHGWQRQEGDLATVQGALESALAQLDPSQPAVTGAGRTDTGVHAAGQVAHVDLERPWEPFRLREALNHHLKPHPVAVLVAAGVADDFHARFSAIARRYRYRIATRRPPVVFGPNFVWRVTHPLDVAAMRKAAACLVGKHDFTTFRAAMCQAKSPVKTLSAVTVDAVDEGVELTFSAPSFLHNQVRSFVGTLERVGAGRWSPEDVLAALDARDRAACGPVAPPGGLTLMEVTYPGDPFAAGRDV